MTAPSDCKFIIAPHFYLSADWSHRLSACDGVGAASGHAILPETWRPLTPDELSQLVWDADDPPPSEILDGCVSLFQLPGHLGAAWWQLLAQSMEVLGEGRLQGFEAFVNQVGEFLVFKHLPVPKSARWDVLVSAPEGRFVPWTLRCGDEPPQSRIWGAINLGDSETSVVLILEHPHLLRLRLAPGEGCRFPRQAAIVGGYSSGKQEADVVLQIVCEN